MDNLVPTYEQYRQTMDMLIDSLRVVDTYVDGLHKPHSIKTNDWEELENSPGVFIKNIVLHQPNSFALAIVHGFAGAKQEKHKLADNVEIHITNGKMAINNLEFKASDRIFIPANQEYCFEYLEDTYLTAKFVPINKITIDSTKYGSYILTKNKISSPEA